MRSPGSATVDATDIVAWTARLPEWEMTWIDPAIVDLLGFSSSAWREQAFWLDHVDRADRPRVAAFFARVAAAAAALSGDAIEYRFVDAAGNTRWLRTAARRVSADLIAGVHVDVTSVGGRGVWDAMPFSAVVLDEQSTILETNAAWRALIAAAAGPHDAFLGANYLEIAQSFALRGHQASERADAIAAVAAGTADQCTFDYQCPCPGEEGFRWHRLRAVGMHGTIRAALVTHIDIHELKAAECEAQRYRNELAHVQRLAVLGELATSIAHELNQPLAVIQASASTARRVIRDRSGSELLPAIIDDIIESTSRAAAVVRRARRLVRRDAVMETVSINDVVSTVARIVASDIVIEQVFLTLDLGDELPQVYGDPVQLQQVILNLLLNAIDAVNSLPLDRRRVSVVTRRARTHCDAIELVVMDSGAGLPPVMRDRIFDAFVTTKRNGTGLGLAIVKAIVEAHNGVVTADFPAQGGAAFRVTLPTQEQAD